MKLDGRTLDIKELNIQKLKQLFPESFTDGKFDVAKMAQLLGDYNEEAQEKYDFTWHGKAKALKMSQTPSMGTLRPSKADSKDWDNTQNLYIEGDNLEVLKLLQKSYYNKADLLYLDPPYNTGNDIIYKNDFVYSDLLYRQKTSQVDSTDKPIVVNSETSGRYHTTWVNMMYPRLRIARNLLKDTGFIAISIDHNELFNLGKISDEVFGEDNRVAIIAVIHKPEGRNQAKFIGPSHEYLFIYAKNITTASLQKVVLDEELSKKFIHSDLKGKYRLKNFIRLADGKYSTKYMKPKHWYPIYVNPLSLEITKDKSCHTIEVFPVTKTGVERTWKTTYETFIERLDNQDIIAKKEDNNISIYEKLREDQVIKTHWNKKEYHGYHFGTKILDELLGNKTFDFPKSIFLMKDIIKLLCPRQNGTIFDVFSGSATTAHAVMQLNAEDGGNRKHIMVQLPETTDEKSEAYKAGYKNICEIGKERIRRAGEQIKANLQEKWDKATEEERKEMKNPSELDTGFKVFKLDTSNIKRWNPSEDLDADKLDLFLKESIDNYVEGRTERDVLYEVILKMGLELTYPIDEVVSTKGTKIYSVALGALMVCLDDKIDLDVADKMIELHQELQPKTWRVLFKDNGFIDDQVKTNIRETLKSAGLAEDAFTTL